MLLTKYEHACFTIEEDSQVLVVDPGNFTTDFKVTDNIVAIVITHEHADHFDPNLLASIYDKNPDSVLISLESITEKMPDHKSHAVAAGETFTVGPFNLEFFGGTHAQIHPDIPLIDNLGVLVNQRLYYPGDSFTGPNKPVEILALPASAPWLKISESLDFLMQVKPQFTFPTHDAILSATGKGLTDRLIGIFADKVGSKYTRLDGQTLEI
ncbi:MBL fold metallo-hydrolase [Patescibacteria group bacterium]|nr:MAG: MBL fold metallo-hydrolase [Patescibacteria group bacterium]